MASNTVAILLAGGKSERMGVAKGLLKYGKTFWILEQIDRLGKNGIQKVYVGLGHDFEHYFWGIDWFEQATQAPVYFMEVQVKVVINKNPDLGSFSTLQSVLKFLNPESDVLFNPIDVPIPTEENFSKIFDSKNSVIIPKHLQKNGHPIKLGSLFWNGLLKLDPHEKNARLDVQIKKLPPEKITYVSVNQSSILKNINTPGEWKIFLKGN